VAWRFARTALGQSGTGDQPFYATAFIRDDDGMAQSHFLRLPVGLTGIPLCGILATGIHRRCLTGFKPY
jgi:hypothetical protein